MANSIDTNPWAADRPLSDEAASSIIAAQFPEIKPVRITGRYEGWDNQAVEVNDVWIFRFPKRADCVIQFRKELALLQAVGPLLPVAAPEYQFFGEPADAFPYVFAGYRKVEGIPAIEFSGRDLPLSEIVASLAEILRTLHTVSVDRARSLGVLPADDGSPAVAEALAGLEDVGHHIVPGVCRRCRDFLLANSGFHRPLDVNVLLHSDLSAEHLLLSSESGQVTGLIDWTDAEIGDPAFDFGYLWHWQGDAFVRAVYGAYTDASAETFLERARIYGVMSAISDLHYGIAAAKPRYRESGLRALRRLGATE